MAVRHARPSTMEPSAWVARFAPLVPEGSPVLDVACGGGRHTRFFLDRDHPVTAMDRDLSMFGPPRDAPGLTLIEADLEDGTPWPPGDARFGCVLVSRYLHRPLMASLVAAVAPGGVLIYETFAEGQEKFCRPRNPDHLLRPGELLETVRGKLRVLAFEDIQVEKPKPAMIQRICALCPAS